MAGKTNTKGKGSKPPSKGKSNTNTKAPPPEEQKPSEAGKAPAPLPPLPPLLGMPGAGKGPPLPAFAPPVVPAFGPPMRPAGLARPSAAVKPQTGADLPSGVYPGGAAKVQPAVGNPLLQQVRAIPSFSTNAVTGGAPAAQYRPAQKAGPNVLPTTLQGPQTSYTTRPTTPQPGQTSAGTGGYRPQTSGGRGQAGGRAFPEPQGTGQVPLEVTADGIVLTKADFAYAARYSGLAIDYARQTGDRKYLPTSMHWRTVAQLTVPPEFGTVEEFLTALGYQVDADGNWRKWNPVVNTGYGGGGYATQSASGYGGYGGYTGYERGGGYAGSGPSGGLIQWRIG